MLVNIGNMIINTDNITTVTEEKGQAVIYFVGGVPKNIILSVNLEGFTKYLNDAGVSTYG